MRRPRHLTPEERALWDNVARRTAPLRTDRPTGPARAEGPPAAPADPPPIAPPDPPRQQAFRLGEKVDHRRDHDLLPGLIEDMGRAPVRMDARTHKKMTRGKLQPEARIDLHGMTLAQAHGALAGFILSQQAAGRRLVLVITGKGRERDELAPMPVRQGALRHQVPQWLALPPLRSAVLQITPAHQRHGGTGAYYVYLRR